MAMCDSEASERFRSPAGNRRCPPSGGGSSKLATGHGRLHQSAYGNYATDDKINKLKIRQKHRLATWNVRGLLMMGKLHIMENELERNNISIAGLAELHYRNEGHFTSTKGNFICFSGNPNESRNGVGFWVAKTFAKIILGYQCLNDRIITLRVNATPTPINLVQVYAPTLSTEDEVLQRPRIHN